MASIFVYFHLWGWAILYTSIVCPICLVIRSVINHSRQIHCNVALYHYQSNNIIDVITDIWMHFRKNWTSEIIVVPNISRVRCVIIYSVSNDIFWTLPLVYGRFCVDRICWRISKNWKLSHFGDWIHWINGALCY